MYVPQRRYPPRPEAGPCPPIRTGPTTWTLAARVGRADVYALSGRLVELIRRTGTSLVVCDVAAITRPDAGTLHVLARLTLTARRLRCGLVLRGAGGRLRGLVAFAGLADVLTIAEPDATDEFRAAAPSALPYTAARAVTGEGNRP